MIPAISALVKRLMYPGLLDDARTLDRPPMRGIRSNVVFWNHEQHEVEDSDLADRLDEATKASRQNIFEARMVVKIVRYLAQQGYGTDKQVVLTPYLGQLRLLQDHLMTEHDPILNDMDSSDLMKAGLMSHVSERSGKKSLRISTIGKSQVTHFSTVTSTYRSTDPVNVLFKLRFASKTNNSSQITSRGKKVKL